MKTLSLTTLLLTAPLAHAAEAPPASESEVQLRAIDLAHVQAYVASDQEYLSEHVDQNFRFTSAGGDWLDKSGFVVLDENPAQAGVISRDDVRVRVFADVGIVHALAVCRNPDGAESKTRYTNVYRRDGATWRLISAQLSMVAGPSVSALKHAAAPDHARWRGEEPTGDDEQVLRALNAGYVQAFLDSDVAWYDAHLAPDYLAVLGDGSFHDKDSLLAAAVHPVTNMRSFRVTNVVIRRFGEVALIHAENPYERTDGLKGVNRYTDIWHKRDGRWVCIAAHVTRHKLPS